MPGTDRKGMAAAATSAAPAAGTATPAPQEEVAPVAPVAPVSNPSSSILGDVRGDDAVSIVENLEKDFPAEVTTLTRYIKAVNEITEKDGYSLITVTLDKPVKVMQADKDDDTTFVETTSKRIQSIVGSIVAVIRSNESLAPYYQLAKENNKLLYSWLVGCKVTIVEMEVEDGRDFVNPFSEVKTIRNYEGKRILHFIADIKEIPSEAMKRVKLDYILSKTALSGDALLSLI